MADTRRDFFISFNSADLAFAEAIDAALNEAGFTTFFHPRDLLPGGIVPEWMEKSLLNSNQTIALFSPDYVKEEAVYSFIERYASWWRDKRGKERKLIPVHIRKVDFTDHPIAEIFSRIECVGKNPKDAAAHVVQRLRGPEETKERQTAQMGGNLPSTFHVAYRPNPNFTGRFDDLDVLQNTLLTENAAVTAVAGTGGIGKTTLAAEYCHRFGGRYGGVWWIRAEQDSVLLSDIVALGEKLKLEQSGNIEVDARACLEALTIKSEPWLLVFDNAPDADKVGKWLPAGKTRCIITSRRSDFSSIAKVTRLDQWLDETTSDYLLSRTGRNDTAGAMRLAKCLGGLPLAAEQAAVFLVNRKGISFDDYAADIARLIKRKKDAGIEGDYPDTVYAAFVKSLETLRTLTSGETALDILRLCAFLSPDGVDLTLLTGEWGGEGLPTAFAAAMAGKFTREDALAALASLSLLRQEDGTIGTVVIFHRLLLEVVRDWMGQESRTRWSGVAAKLVDSLFPFDSDDDPSQWPLCALLMAHVAPLELYSARIDIAGRAVDRLLNQAGVYLYARGDRKGALALVERSVELKRVTCVDEPSALATSLNNLGGRYADLDRLDEAENTYREALEIEEPRLDRNDPSLAITLSNLAGVYWRRKEYAKTEPLYLRAAEIMKATHGVESAEYGIVISNLGALYCNWADEPGQASRRTQEAEFKSQALSVTLAARGTRHPGTVNLYNNLAVMKAKTGDWLGAAKDIERAIAIMLSLDLSEHPNTQLCARHLCHFWDQSSQRDKAARLLKGDVSDLLPVIEQIEAEHRAWVAEDPKNRHFGPPSPFDP